MGTPANVERLTEEQGKVSVYAREQGAQVGLNHVGYVGEAAGLAAIAVQGKGLIHQEASNEPVKSHVGPLARAIDRKIPERYGRYPIVDVVKPRQVLGGQLCDPIGRDRQRGTVFAKREGIGLAVDGRGGSKDEPSDGDLLGCFK